MKRFLLSLLALAAFVPGAFAVEDWQNPDVNQRSRVPMHTSFATDSPRLSLEGIWKFQWYESPGERSLDFFKPGVDDSGWGSMPVPGMWELNGYGDPLYVNIQYAWDGHYQNNPPIVPTEHNYVGQYRRSFDIPAEWAGSDIFLSVGSATSNLRLWVNGKEVGYSEDSKLEARFDITKYVKPGQSALIAMEIFRWCDGTYLECQDFWRYAGIAREVFLTARPKARIEDLHVSAGMDGGFRFDASLTKAAKGVKFYLSGPGYPEREVPASGRVEGAALWSAESPSLYHLRAVCSDKKGETETAELDFGFRTVEIRGRQLLVNGQPILIKGADRHEMSATGGYVVTVDEMLEDIRIMKELNINTVRTSHYPNDPRMYALYDYYGLYIVDEADQECHGNQAISNMPSWEGAYVDRAVRMVRRDRLHPSVFFWSLGNESGKGCNIVAERNAVKALDSRPVHYEGQNEVADFDSQMYPSLEDMIRRDRNGADRPYYLCEYAHAMGNAIGNLAEYWDYIENDSERMIGACIWDWVDQAIVKPGANDGKLYFGGSFGDMPNDNDFCCNGIVTADRRITPKLQQVKAVYQYIKFRQPTPGTLVLENRYTTYNLDEMDLRYAVQHDGKQVAEGRMPLPDTAPWNKCTVELPVAKDLLQADDCDVTLQVEIALKKATRWVGAGHVVAAEEFILHETEGLDFSTSPKVTEVLEPLQVYFEESRILCIRNAAVSVRFDKTDGRMQSLCLDGSEILHGLGGPVFNYYRYLSNDGARFVLDQAEEHLEAQTRLTAFRYKVKDGFVRVETALEANVGGIAVPYTVTYDVHAAGYVDVDARFTAGADFNLRRLGLQMFLDPAYEQVTWYGRGPMENYQDRKDCAFLGIYENTVTGMAEHYVRTQTMGGRTDTRWLRFTAEDGRTVTFTADGTFDFSAQHFTDTDLYRVKYGNDLDHIRRSEVVLNLDCRMAGVGNASCGPDLLPQYSIAPGQEYSYRFRIW